MNVVDKLVIALELDSKGIDKGIATAQNKLSTGFKGIIGKVFAPLMAGISFGTIFDSIYTELKQMNSLSKATRSSIEDITAWSRAVSSSGGDVDGFSQSLMNLNQNLTKIAVTGNGRIKPFFEKLGLDATELAKKPVLDSVEAIGKAIDGLDKRESANILRSMGFDEGTIKLLQSGEKGIRELISKERELGVYTEKDAKAFSAMNKSFREITSSIKTLFVPAVMLILDLSSRVARYLTAGITYIRKNIDLLRGALILLAAVFHKQLLTAIRDVGRALMMNPFGLFILGLTGLLLLLEDLWVYAKGGKTAFGEMWKYLGTPQEVMNGFKRVGELISGFFKMIGGFSLEKSFGSSAKFVLLLAGSLAALVAAVGAIPVAIGVAVGAIIVYWDKIVKFCSDIIKAFEATGKIIVGIFKAIFGSGGLINTVIDGVMGFIDDMLVGTKSGVNDMFGSLREIGASVDSVFSEAFDYVTGRFDGLVDSFNSGCSAIAGFLSNAANTAKNAWNGFISWLEQKWNWLKGLLPTFESIANKLPSVGNSVRLSTQAGGGTTTNNKMVTDNRNITNHYHTAESVKQGRRESGLVSYADTGVAFP